MKFDSNDLYEVFQKSKTAFCLLYIEQMASKPETRLPSEELGAMASDSVGAYLQAILHNMPRPSNTGDDLRSIFAPYSNGEEAVARVFAAASRTEKTLREMKMKDRQVDLFHTVTFTLADYLLAKEPS